jgi:hypothetical protein
VVKVEVKQNTFNPPFTANVPFTVYYDYQGQQFNVSVSMDGYFSQFDFITGNWIGNEQLSIKYNWPDRISALILDRKHFGFVPITTRWPLSVYRPSASMLQFEGNRIIQVIDTFDAMISLIGWCWYSQFHILEFSKEFSVTNSIAGSYSHEDGFEHLTEGQGIKMGNYRWEGNFLKSYKLENTLNKYWPIEFELIGHPDVADLGDVLIFNPVSSTDFEVSLRYTTAPGVPKMLLKMINQSLGDLLPTAMSNYIITHPSLFSAESFYWRTFGEEIPKPTSYFNNDWILTFAEPRLTVLPEQDKIISSKTIQGQYLSNIVSNQPVYKTMNSTVTFPYTHDPVAKTLEIAGLKIWYEVVEY